jgi:hypothetical protein
MINAWIFPSGRTVEHPSNNVRAGTESRFSLINPSPFRILESFNGEVFFQKHTHLHNSAAPDEILSGNVLVH